MGLRDFIVPTTITRRANDNPGLQRKKGKKCKNKQCNNNAGSNIHGLCDDCMDFHG